MSEIQQCRRCGDPDNNFIPVGNVTIDDNGVYVPSQCPSCQTYGASHLVEKLNQERCDCRGLGHVDVVEGVVKGRACPRCMAIPTEETLQRVRELVASST